MYKKYPSLKADFEKFKRDFCENQEMGEDLGGGFYKVRMAIESKHKGKSGGARVIIYNFFLRTVPNDVLLIDIYDKSELSTMQDFEYEKIAKEFI
ncbi:MAG: type II toxin-antitoxin system RelE/ParE family toxin [Tannerella sp.]|nr:type II toxin-antitoxin system RelE/ParE family toxin [Tannerella sp.]